MDLKSPGSPGIGTRCLFLLGLERCSIHTYNTGKRNLTKSDFHEKEQTGSFMGTRFNTDIILLNNFFKVVFFFNVGHF